MTTSPPSPAFASAFTSHAWKLSAATHLLLHTARESTQLAGEMHTQISRALPWEQPETTALPSLPLPYRLVYAALKRLANGSWGQRPAQENHPPGWLQFEGILNGVCGDKLARWGSPLAVPMRLLDEAGQTLTLRPDSRGLVIFIHGLCASEHFWQHPAHDNLVQHLRTEGYQVGWLRYNSGLAIHENARAFDALLREKQITAPLQLIGHSMGGLLIRASCHIAANSSEPDWLMRLSHAAYLGSPHQGAPLERLGNRLNAFLGGLAYTHPLRRLGNIRSQGIKDLRHGCVTAEDSEQLHDGLHGDPRLSITPLPAHVHHFCIAGSLPTGATVLGDGLVPVNSALGEHPDPLRRLQAPSLQKEYFPGRGHLELLRDDAVAAALQSWLLNQHSA